MEKKLKHLKTFEQNTDKNLNISDVSESVSKEDRFLIDGSGLFFFNTSLDDETKLKITKWYKNLSDDDRKYVDILRNEASDESEYFSQDD